MKLPTQKQKAAHYTLLSYSIDLQVNNYPCLLGVFFSISSTCFMNFPIFGSL